MVLGHDSPSNVDTEVAMVLGHDSPSNVDTEVAMVLGDLLT